MTTILKLHGAAGETDAARCAAFNFDDLAVKGNLYLAEIRRQAEAMLTQARDEAAQLRRQATEQGRADALKAAQQQSQAKSQKDLDQRLQTLIPALTAGIDEIRQAKTAWRSHWERRTIELAVAIAARVVRRELAAAPEIALDLIRESLELAVGSGRLVLRLNPQDFQNLGEQAEKIASRLGKEIRVEITPDAEMTVGGCVVKTEFGEIDQRIETQLARIAEELIG